MNHVSRQWFVEALDSYTHRFLSYNLMSINTDTGLLTGADVEEVVDGKKVIMKKNLMEISSMDLDTLRRAAGNKDLRYRVYMRESSGAKITPWVFKIRKPA